MLIKLQYLKSSGEIQGFVTIDLGAIEGFIGDNQLFITHSEYEIIKGESARWKVIKNHLVRYDTNEDINDWIKKDEVRRDEDQSLQEKTIEKIQEVDVKSLSGFLDAIKSFDKDPSTTPLFRGQSKRWSLIPKLGRFPILKGEPRYLTEKKMLSDLKRMSTLFLETKTDPDTELEWLSIAQHHGMATRMLDWTFNPLVALWFSVSEGTKDASSKSGEVWCFYPSGDDIINNLTMSPFSVTKIMVYLPNHVSKRITTQNGCFTIHPYIPQNSTYADNERDNFLTLHSKNCISKYSLFNISIQKEFFEQIRNELNKCGINNSSMFPDMNGLCRQIEEQYLSF